MKNTAVAPPPVPDEQPVRLDAVESPVRRLAGRDGLLWPALAIVLISIGHYLLPTDWEIGHNIFQRLYYLPIVWAAYRRESRGGLLAAGLAAILYLPHIIVTWQLHRAYQVSQTFEIIMFLLAGYFIGWLFEQRSAALRSVQSLERMAQFGSLARAVIRSLKAPVKSVRGMVITLRALVERDPGAAAALDVIEKQVNNIEQVRSDLISLVSRRRLRLKRHSINDLAKRFLDQVQGALAGEQMSLAGILDPHDPQVHVNTPALLEALHELLSRLVRDAAPGRTVTVYTGHSSRFVWIGAATDSIALPTYYLSRLSSFNGASIDDYQLVQVLNIVNAHFADLRLRHTGGNMVEFIVVLPRRIRLPWYLRDEPVQDQLG